MASLEDLTDLSGSGAHTHARTPEQRSAMRSCTRKRGLCVARRGRGARSELAMEIILGVGTVVDCELSATLAYRREPMETELCARPRPARTGDRASRARTAPGMR